MGLDVHALGLGGEYEVYPAGQQAVGERRVIRFRAVVIDRAERVETVDGAIDVQGRIALGEADRVGAGCGNEGQARKLGNG